MSASKDLTNKRFGRLMALSRKAPVKGKTTWLCKCDCGNHHIRTTNNLQRSGGRIQSCGCYQHELRQKIAQNSKDNLQKTVVRALFRDYIRSAKHRNFEFELLSKNFSAMIMGICHYCGQEPSRELKAYSNRTKIWTFAGIKVNGVDRKNPQKGYTQENCVTACTTCNYAKLDMQYEEFLSYIERLSHYAAQKKILKEEYHCDIVEISF